MIRFETLSLKNFLSYGAAPTVINLDRPGTTLILGEDLDSTSLGAGANGVGKTVIINALVYALYDKPISNISKDNLVNNANKKNMIVTLDFRSGDDQYRIERARKTKAGAAGNWVKLYHNGVDVTPDSVGNTNKEIERIVGLPFDLFIRICAVSANHTPFLDLPVRHPTQANQTDIIEKLFDLKTLTEKADVLKAEIKEAERSLELHTTRVEALANEYKRQQKATAAADRRVMIWEDENQKKITAVEAKLDKVRHIDVDGQKEAVEAYERVTVEVKETRQKLDAFDAAMSKLIREIEAAQKQADHLDKGECPYCLQEYAAAEAKRDELSHTIDSLGDDLEALTELRTTEKEKWVTKKTEKELIGATVTVSSLDELYDIRGKIDRYERELKDLRAANNPMVAVAEEEHRRETELDEIDTSTINELTSLISHQKFLLKLLTKKDSFVRKALLNKNIPFLNVRLAGYLLELGLPHTVEFTHEMTASISQFGRPMDFGNLSNGQRARVNIALSFAFRDVLQSIHERVNVCMLDEVLDVGLDAVGIQAAAKMIKNKAREEGIAMYIISHRDEIDSAFDRVMNIQMSKGFSYLGEEDV